MGKIKNLGQLVKLFKPSGLGDKSVIAFHSSRNAVKV
jgi:hypothetical protein